MSGSAPPVVRLRPMSEEEFRESLRQSMSRHAADYVRRGLWRERESVEAMEREFAQLLPNGRATADRFFATVVDPANARRVGEVWYRTREQGGTLEFLVDWIATEPEHRRKGYATATLLRLEEEARQLGADRMGLSVWFDNPGAIALYSKLGYVPSNMRMSKPLGPGRISRGAEPSSGQPPRHDPT